MVCGNIDFQSALAQFMKLISSFSDFAPRLGCKYCKNKICFS